MVEDIVDEVEILRGALLADLDPEIVHEILEILHVWTRVAEFSTLVDRENDRTPNLELLEQREPVCPDPGEEMLRMRCGDEDDHIRTRDLCLGRDLTHGITARVHDVQIHVLERNSDCLHHTRDVILGKALRDQTTDQTRFPDPWITDDDDPTGRLAPVSDRHGSEEDTD